MRASIVIVICTLMVGCRSTPKRQKDDLEASYIEYIEEAKKFEERCSYITNWRFGTLTNAFESGGMPKRVFNDCFLKSKETGTALSKWFNALEDEDMSNIKRYRNIAVEINGEFTKLVKGHVRIYGPPVLKME
tara:strand:- start:346 stop:744 length:399 start_codon:yes stop_codon:yes gene_type:complete